MLLCVFTRSVLSERLHRKRFVRRRSAPPEQRLCSSETLQLSVWYEDGSVGGKRRWNRYDNAGATSLARRVFLWAKHTKLVVSITQTGSCATLINVQLVSLSELRLNAKWDPKKQKKKRRKQTHSIFTSLSPWRSLKVHFATWTV